MIIILFKSFSMEKEDAYTQKALNWREQLKSK